IALSVVFDLTRIIQAALANANPSRQTLRYLKDTLELLAGQILGIRLGSQLSRPQIVDELIELILKERAAARKAGDYAKADALRSELQRLGISIKDTPKGTLWTIT
ncbi:MAG: hypothetical protein QHH07_06040, partial [Sedimentisphaerales bacterium]|nr:hypothetical protein [Sedimentisphaerales bacterium]